ncbi:MAG: hypothetical protein ACQEWI_22670 [Bacillota bacterium]
MKRILMIILLLTLTLGVTVYYFINYNDHTKSGGIDPSIKSYLTLKEAIALGVKETKKKTNSNVKLLDITSVDTDGTKNNEGENGRRKNWNLTLVSDNGNPHYISIEGSKITLSESNRTTKISETLIPLHSISKDSSYFIKKAKNSYGLKPGLNFAKGFHFVMANGQDDQPVMTVYGTNSEGYITRIHFNIFNGKVLGIDTKEPNGGGIFRLSNGNLVSLEDDADSVVGVNISTKSELVTWGYKSPGKVNSTAYIKYSSDLGVKWKNLDVNEKNIIKAWTQERGNSIYYSTDKSIKEYDRIEGEIRELFKTTNIIDVKSSKNNIVALTEKGIYTSSNNYDWDFIETDISFQRIELDDQGKIWGLFNNEIYKQDLMTKSFSTLDLPKNIGIITSFELSGEDLLLYADSVIWRKNIKSSKWDKYTYEFPIEKVFFNSSSTKAFIVNEDGLFEIDWTKGGQAVNIIEDKVIQNGIITDIKTSSATSFITISPTFDWRQKGKSM